MKVYVESNDDGTTEEDKLLPPLNKGIHCKNKVWSRSSILLNRLQGIQKHV